MTEKFQTSQQSLEAFQAIDLLCERFEKSLTTGEAISIESLLSNGPEQHRSQLLEELLHVDLEHRCLAGEQPLRSDYFGRFPDMRDAVVSAFVCMSDSFPILASDVRRLPGYSLLEVVGEGGIGIVYKAKQLATNRVVAIKVLRESWEVDQDVGERFRREAETIARISHPHIVEVFDAGEHEGHAFFALEYCQPGSLSDRLSGRLPEQGWTVNLIEKVASAVHAAHSVGVIHRDIKPANILFTDAGEPKVTDFGLARDTMIRTRAATQTGEALGTPEYMSPEQLRGEQKKVGPQSDVYSIGVVLYECLTGRTPFRGSLEELTLGVLRKDPKSIRKSNPAVAKHLETICLKCLMKDPRHRYANAAELAADLHRLREQQPIRAKPASAVTRLLLWRRRNPTLAVVVGLFFGSLVGIAALSVIFAFSQRRSARNLKLALAQSQRSVAMSNWDRGRRLCIDGEIGAGLLLMASSLQLAPGEDSDLQSAIRMDIAGWRQNCHRLVDAWQHPDEVQTVAVFPGGRRAITGCDDGKVRIWSLETNELIAQQEAHRGGVSAIAIAPTGQSFATAGLHGRILVWDAASLTNFELIGHTDEVRSLAFCPPDGRFLLSGGKADLARLWSLPDGHLSEALAWAGDVNTVCFSPDGSEFLLGGEDKTTHTGRVQFFATESAAPINQGSATLHFGRPVRSAAFSADGQMLLVGDDDWDATFIDLDVREPLASTSFGRGAVAAVDFSKGDTIAAILAYDSNRVLLWNVDAVRASGRYQRDRGLELKRDEHELISPRLDHPYPVTDVEFAPDGARILTASEDGYVRIWEWARGPTVTKLPHHSKHADRNDNERDFVVRAIALNPTGDLAATAGWDGRVLFWSVPSGTREGESLQHPTKLMDLAFSPSGNSLVTGGRDGLLRIWGVASRRCVHELSHHAQIVSGLDIGRSSPLAIVGGDGMARLWDLSTQNTVGELFQHGDIDVSLAVAVSPDQTRFLTAGEDAKARLWSASGMAISELQHQAGIWNCTFDEDSLRVMTASDDGTAKIWDAHTGELRATLDHQNESVFAAAFVPGSRDLVVTGGAGGAYLWDVGRQRQLGPSAFSLEGDVMDVAINKAGDTALLAVWSGFGAVWLLPEPLLGPPKLLMRRLEVETAMSLDEAGGTTLLTGPDWISARDQLDRLDAQ